MFRIINFKSLLKYVAFVTVFLSICAYKLMQFFWLPDLSVIKIISITPWIALITIITITTNLTARPIWKLLKKLKPSLYPDLNGTWEGEIITDSNLKIPIRAVIKQTLLETQLNIHTETSKSTTLETTPSVDQGEQKLYYIYRSTPKDPNWQAFIGSTIFDVRNINKDSTKVLELSGSYFTDRKTNGRIRLQQIGTDVDQDVSYY